MSYSCPRITHATLVSQCRELGLSPGDTAMVHVSLRAVSPLLGGPDILTSALMEALSPGGTLMVYIGCQTPFDDVGRGIFSPEDETFILEHCPPFDPASARASRDFGAFAEFFRTWPGVKASGNPGARMAAYGERAAFLTDGHPLNYGLGEGSPLEKLCNLEGKVLLVGSDPDCTTMLHYAEALAPLANKRVVHLTIPILAGGERTWVAVEEFNSSQGIREWPDQFFAHLVTLYLEQGLSVKGRLGDAETFCFKAQGLVDFAIPLMVETARRLDELKDVASPQ
jgi:aminoglycoside 3-N-acetyltransferase